MTPLKPISRPKPPGIQKVIWPWVGNIAFKSVNQANPYIGDWAEEYVSRFTGGDRLMVDATRICPDIQLTRNQFMEVKAVGPKRAPLMYRLRYERYRQLVKDSGLQFVMVFYGYDFGANKPADLKELRRIMAASVEQVLVFPAKTVLDEVQRTIRRRGWDRANGKPEDYQELVRLSLGWLNHFRRAKPHRPERIFPVRVYDDEVSYVSLRRVRAVLPDTARVGVHPPELRRAAGIMLEELLAGWHDVALRPIGDGRKVRVVQERNVEWYERMCRENQTGIRGRSSIPRRNVISALKLISRDRPVVCSLEERVLPYIHQWIEDRQEPMLDFG